MVYFLSILTSIFIAVMIAINGNLTAVYGVPAATAIIHLVGLLLITGTSVFRKERLFSVRGLPITLFSGGAIGVATTLFNNMAYGMISVSAIIALSLLGQAVTSLLIDQYGWFGMPARKFTTGKLIGLLFTIFGIVCLLLDSSFLFLPVLVSFLSGISIVVSRTINAALGEKTSVMVSAWYNFAVGMVVALVILFLSGGRSAFPAAVDTRWWIYLGGTLGVAVVFLSNVTTPRMPAFHLTLILFAGQVFTGIALDAAMAQGFSMQSLLGGLLVTIGLSLNVWLDYRSGNLSEL